MPIQAVYLPIGVDRPIQVALAIEQPIGGWNIEFRVVTVPTPAVGAPATILKNTANGGVIITNAALGIFDIVFNSVDTASLPAGDYQYDVWRTDAGSEYAIVPASPFILTQFPSSP